MSGLDAAMQALGTIPGRKNLVLVSAGIDTPKEADSTAALTPEARRISRTAEAANVTLNVLYTGGSAVQKLGLRLFSFARVTGGTFYQLGLNADRFVGNLVKDARSYYVLDVVLNDADRDGKQHPLTVRLDNTGATTVRSRGFVTIPAR
jgi:hypothetical protein